MKPPARYAPQWFTTAYNVCKRASILPNFDASHSDAAAERTISGAILIHGVTRRNEWFAVAGCDASWRIVEWPIAYAHLEAALLAAREWYGIPTKDWEIFEPDLGQKLYGRPRNYAERRHRRARKAMQEIRWRFRPSNRLVQAITRQAQQLRSAGDVTGANMIEIFIKRPGWP